MTRKDRMMAAVRLLTVCHTRPATSILSPTCTPFEFPCSDVYRRNYAEWLDAAERLLR
jgi:hypothetical protein